MFAAPSGYDQNALNRHGSAQVMHGSDAQLFVEFFDHPVEQGLASSEAGRPIFKDVPYVRITVPSNTGTIKQETVRAANEDDRRRFPQQWENYQAGQKDKIVGTPLAEWAVMPRSEVLMLGAAGVHSIEQLAALTDAVIQNLGPGYRQWQQRARAALDVANDPTTAIDALTRENSDLKDQLAAMKSQLADVVARLPSRDDDDQPKRGPGRPRKAE